MSPTSRNTSPRSTASLSNSGMERSAVLQAAYQQQRSIEEFMPDSDSEDDPSYQPNALSAENLRASSLNVACVSTDTADEHSLHRRLPVHLPPIDTSLGFHVNPLQSMDRPKSKSFRSLGRVETPQKKVRMNEPVLASGTEFLNEMHVPHRQVYGASQPPFNTGIPSIFAPHSLTPETNPFFLQSSLPCTTRLPPLRTLLGQSSRANPFLEELPPYLQSEMNNVPGFETLHEPYLHNPFGLGLREGCRHWTPPDPSVGFGFTFGGNVALTAPPWVSPPPLPVLNAFVSDPMIAEELLLQAGCPPMAPMMPPYISTPNIDRACQFLQNPRAGVKTDRPSAVPLRKDSSSSAFSATSTTSPDPMVFSPITTTHQNCGRDKHRTTTENGDSGDSQSSTAGLFATPQVTLPVPGALSQASQALWSQYAQSQSQGQGQAYGQGDYQWTGSSIGSLHHLGVDVLTPAGLPQCTPIAESAHAHASRDQSFSQAVDHENMLFLHSMLTDPFSELAQEDLFSLNRDPPHPSSVQDSDTCHKQAQQHQDKTLREHDQPDPDEVLEKWLASARSPQVTVPAAAAAALPFDVPHMAPPIMHEA